MTISHSFEATVCLACSTGVFFERAICSRKHHVETSRREEEMGQVKGSWEGAGKEKRNFIQVSCNFSMVLLIGDTNRQERMSYSLLKQPNCMRNYNIHTVGVNSR